MQQKPTITPSSAAKSTMPRTDEAPTTPPKNKKPAAPAIDRTEAFDGMLAHQDSTPPGETEVFGGADPGAGLPQDEESADESPDQESQQPTQAMDDAEVAAVSKKPAPAVKTSTMGDYKLLKKLGQGGMGAVYKAHQMSLDRDVAVKVLSKELAAKPNFVQRFLREARVMAKLDHPNVLRCFEVGNAGGHHFISMEFVEGGSVENWLKKLGRFDIADALCIVITVARALEHAHEQSLVHRDIKPDNILLTKKGVVKVADLGLAKATDDDLGLTRTGTGAGTPIYMAPEQARDCKHVDGRCDIYALGVMLYVFLTGQAPFGGSTLVEVVEAKEKGKFKPIRMFNGDVPERLDLIVDKMLANDLKLRYATCTEVVEDLEALGLANDALSFFEGAAPANAAVPAKPSSKPPSRPASTPPAKAPAKPGASPAKAPGAPVQATARPKSSPTFSPGAAAAAASTPSPMEDGDYYYWRFNDESGKTTTKKLAEEEVITLIKSGSIDNKAQISKSLTSGYRSIGAFPEFEAYFRSKVAEHRAGKSADQFKSVLKQIAKEDSRKRKWKWLQKKFGAFGSFVGLIVWLSILAGMAVGGYYGVMFIISKLR